MRGRILYDHADQHVISRRPPIKEKVVVSWAGSVQREGRRQKLLESPPRFGAGAPYSSV